VISIVSWTAFCVGRTPPSTRVLPWMAEFECSSTMVVPGATVSEP
jgi:hypothetical protein